MAYNINTSERILYLLHSKQIDFIEKKMFGGVAFMIEDKMCIGVSKENLMLRVTDEKYTHLLEENHVEEMKFTGKPMHGFLFINPEGFESEKQLERWVDLAIDFSINGIVKTKKKK